MCGRNGAGYPEYAYCSGPEYGYKNLAVFFHACSFNCLYCQNWHFRKETLSPFIISVDELVSDVDEKTSCICYFGGDPAPQTPFALRVSKLAIEQKKGRNSQDMLGDKRLYASGTPRRNDKACPEFRGLH